MRLPCGLLIVFVTSAALVPAQDVSWGKIVRCFVVDGTTVCPECNYRAGLLCPRKKVCDAFSTEPPISINTIPHEEEYSKTEGTTAYVKETDTTTVTQTTATNNRELPLLQTTKKPLDMAIYLYRLLGPHGVRRRFKRQDEGSCTWNGDCPCPLICCNMGNGCPKRCVMGIRLPPPWG